MSWPILLWGSKASCLVWYCIFDIELFILSDIEHTRMCISHMLEMGWSSTSKEQTQTKQQVSDSLGVFKNIPDFLLIQYSINQFKLPAFLKVIFSQKRSTKTLGNHKFSSQVLTIEENKMSLPPEAIKKLMNFQEIRLVLISSFRYLLIFYSFTLYIQIGKSHAVISTLTKQLLLLFFSGEKRYRKHEFFNLLIQINNCVATGRPFISRKLKIRWIYFSWSCGHFSAQICISKNSIWYLFPVKSKANWIPLKNPHWTLIKLSFILLIIICDNCYKW